MKWVRHFFQQNSPSSTAPVVNRKTRSQKGGTASKVFFIIKKEVPQIKAARNSRGLARRRITASDMENGSSHFICIPESFMVR